MAQAQVLEDISDGETMKTVISFTISSIAFFALCSSDANFCLTYLVVLILYNTVDKLGPFKDNNHSLDVRFLRNGGWYLFTDSYLLIFGAAPRVFWNIVNGKVEDRYPMDGFSEIERVWLYTCVSRLADNIIVIAVLLFNRPQPANPPPLMPPPHQAHANAHHGQLTPGTHPISAPVGSVSRLQIQYVPLEDVISILSGTSTRILFERRCLTCPQVVRERAHDFRVPIIRDIGLPVIPLPPARYPSTENPIPSSPPRSSRLPGVSRTLLSPESSNVLPLMPRIAQCSSASSSSSAQSSTKVPQSNTTTSGSNQSTETPSEIAERQSTRRRSNRAESRVSPPRTRARAGRLPNSPYTLRKLK